ncbi:MAG: hypothetical protein ACREIU_15125, partial [Planctomycetota bacterium]
TRPPRGEGGHLGSCQVHGTSDRVSQYMGPDLRQPPPTCGRRKTVRLQRAMLLSLAAPLALAFAFPATAAAG